MTVRFGKPCASVWRNIVIAIACATLISCTQELILNVQINGKDVVIAFMKSEFPWGKKPRMACVMRATLYEEATNREIWSIAPSNAECRNVASFVVGTVPVGFSALRAERPVTGRMYHASVVSGAGNGISDTWKQP